MDTKQPMIDKLVDIFGWICVFLLVFMMYLIATAEGPLFRHKDSAIQQEFENVYQDIRRGSRNGFFVFNSSVQINGTLRADFSDNNEPVNGIFNTSLGSGNVAAVWETGNGTSVLAMATFGLNFDGGAASSFRRLGVPVYGRSELRVDSGSLGLLIDAGGGDLRLGQGGNLIVLIDSTTVHLKGTNLGDDATAGDYGEYVEKSSVTFSNFPTSGQAGDLASISLSSGDWDVSGLLEATANGATVTLFIMGVSTNSGNVIPDSGISRFQAPPPTATYNSSGCVPSKRFNFSVPKTVYLKYYANYSVATPVANGSIHARRMR